MSLIRSLFVTLTLFGSSFTLSVSDYRLPLDFHPLSYNLKIVLDFNTNQFEGDLLFDFHANRTTNTLILNARDLLFNLTSTKLLTANGDRLILEKMVTDEGLERLILVTRTPFLAGTDYKLGLSYTGSMSDDGYGLYNSSYFDKAGRRRHLAVTQFRTVHARRVIPCFDEPHFRAIFKIEIVHPRNLQAISNMPIVSVKESGGRKVTRFEDTPKIPPYLVAFVVSDLAKISSGSFTGWAVPTKVEGIRYATEVMSRLVKAMEGHIGTPYNLKKTDIVAQPWLVSPAMENWGLFNFREEYSLYFPGESKSFQKQDVTRFLSHEIAHCWVGNPITIASWDFFWLNEVFPTYFEYMIPSWVFPQWDMEGQMWLEINQKGLLYDSGPSPPLTAAAIAPAELTTKQIGIIFTKGPALLRMMIKAQTESQFFKGFKKFISENAFSSMVPKDLWDALEPYGDFPTSLNEIMNEWTELPGYPEIVVSRDYTTGEVNVTQVFFSFDSSEDIDSPWWVPLSYTTQTKPNFTDTSPKIWLNGSETQSLVLDPDSWILFNIQATGFFRVNYDANNWAALSSQLQKNHEIIHELNRAQILDDAFNLAKAGRLNYTRAFCLGSYLQKENRFTPWSAGLKAISYVYEVVSGTTTQILLKNYLENLLSRVYREIGFEEKSDEEHLTKVFREQIVTWACRIGVKDCVEKSLLYVLSLANSKPKKISPDVKETALCTGVAYGNEQAWDIVHKLYETSKGEVSKKYLNALGCTTDYKLMKRFLVDSLTETEEKEWDDRFLAFQKQFENSESLLRLLSNHREDLVGAFGDNKYVRIVAKVGNHISSEEYILLIAELNSVGIGGLLETTVQNGLKRIDWLSLYSPDIVRSLTAFADTENTLPSICFE